MVIGYFLVIIAGLWLIFGSIQDLKKKEISNWVTLSLIGIGIMAKLLWSIETGKWGFLLFGLTSAIVCVTLAFVLYYSKVFGGGDAKLLMGLGAFVPGNTFIESIFNSFACVLVLLVVGALYSLIFSFKIAFSEFKKFKLEWKKKLKLYYIIIPVIIVFFAIVLKLNDSFGYALAGIIAFSLILYPYFLAVDNCMIKLYNPKSLTPGDWLQDDVKLGNRTIKSTVHGLSEKEIALLIKARKKVFIKEGVPFVPVFLFSYLIMVFFFVTEGNLLNLVF